MRPALTLALLATLTAGSAFAEVAIVADGQARAVVVLPNKPTAVASYAAEEFVHHVQKATGVELLVVPEGAIPQEPAGRVFIGDTQAARKIGINPEKLTPETFMLRTEGQALFIVGRDADGDALSVETAAGTLFGVYEVLEGALKVRWLWPGELGEVVPRSTTCAVPDVNRTVAPRFLQRNLRSALHRKSSEGFSPEALRKVMRDQAVWLRRHRMGKTVKLHYGHAFTDWGNRYGKERPEWFNLLEDGKRHFTGSFSMCVSNPGFHEEIVRLWRQRRAEAPGQFVNINCCENDIDGRCTCPTCRAWDGPDQKAITERYARRCVSDRYARFWLAVQQLAAKEDPDATVVAYAYVNYAPPPATDIRLNKHIFVGTVPDIFFPRSAEQQEWVKNQWLGWAKTGCRLFLRPNYMLEGYCMPHVFMHQFADEFAFDAGHQMIATDFDSLTAMWSTQGPNLYLLGRMHVRPDVDADTLLAEYYSGFGAAAASVKAYFDYWEKYMGDHRLRNEEIAKARGAGWSSYAVMAHEIFPPESFEPGAKLLEAAGKTVAKDKLFSARVDFLKKGLTHAQMCARVAAVLAGQEGRPSPAVCYRELAQLRAFRKTIEAENVANLNFCATVEQRAWKIPEGYEGEALKPLLEAAGELRGMPVIPARGLHTFVALLKDEEQFRACLSCRRIGQSASACEWTLFGPHDLWIAQGSVEPDTSTMIVAGDGTPGLYCLVVNSGSNVASVTMFNPHAALSGRSIHLLGPSDPLYFYVLPTARKFSIALETTAPGETATMTIVGPSGRPVGSCTTGREARRTVETQVRIGESGRPWSLRIEEGGGGVLEDVILSLDSSVPPYWSHSADRLLIPE